jgi:hypothetical protein
MDLMTHLSPSARGYDAIFVVCDALTRRIELMLCRTDTSAADLAWLLLERVVARYGVPQHVGSDHDSRWSGEIFQNLFEMMNSSSYMAVPYHQQANPAERHIQVVQRVLRTLCCHDPVNWDRYVPVIAMSLNATFNASIGCTPCEADQGYNPRLWPAAKANALEEVKQSSFELIRQRAEEALAWIQEAHEAATAENARTHDAKHVQQTFVVGDRVMVYAHHLRRFLCKMRPRWIGPFEVTEVMTHDGKPNNNYRLQLTKPLSRLHPIFHTSFLKPYRRQQPGQPTNTRPPALEDVGLGDVFVVDAIVGHKKVHGRYKFLVKWKGYEEKDNTWQSVEDILIGGRLMLDAYCHAHDIHLDELVQVMYSLYTAHHMDAVF